MGPPSVPPSVDWALIPSQVTEMALIAEHGLGPPCEAEDDSPTPGTTPQLVSTRYATSTHLLGVKSPCIPKQMRDSSRSLATVTLLPGTTPMHCMELAECIAGWVSD